MQYYQMKPPERKTVSKLRDRNVRLARDSASPYQQDLHSTPGSPRLSEQHQPKLQAGQGATVPFYPKNADMAKHAYLNRNSAACSFGYQSGRLSFTRKHSPRWLRTCFWVEQPSSMTILSIWETEFRKKESSSFPLMSSWKIW